MILSKLENRDNTATLNLRVGLMTRPVPAAIAARVARKDLIESLTATVGALVDKRGPQTAVALEVVWSTISGADAKRPEAVVAAALAALERLGITGTPSVVTVRCARTWEASLDASLDLVEQLRPRIELKLVLVPAQKR